MYIAIAIYLLIINAATYFVYWDDKNLARKKYAWRSSEKRLLTFALLGGTPAAFLACNLHRHKTKKRSFRNTLYFIAVVQVAFLILLAVKF